MFMHLLRITVWLLLVHTMLGLTFLTGVRRMPYMSARMTIGGVTTAKCGTSTENEVDAAFQAKIVEMKKMKAPRKVLGLVEEYSNGGMLSTSMCFTAMKAVTNLNRADLLPTMLPFWTDSSKREQLSGNGIKDERVVGLVVGSVVRLYCRQQLVDAAEKIAASAGVLISEPPSATTEPSAGELQSNPTHSEILPELALGFISQGSVHKAQTCLNTLQSLGLKLDIDSAKKILKQFLTNGRSDTIRRALHTLLQLNSLDDHESVQMITNYYLRSVDFVTGAVSMHTLPTPNCSEVCFIGRSNVGKSSLINMICNRKSLAFTSKTPGKTSEFNYFAAHGVVGVNKEPHKFYLVDLPGVGFARRTKGTRQGWASLLNEYTTSRENLRAIYHLVDSRHGLLDADEECLSILEHLPERTAYVIVLTKADKHNDNEKTTAAMSGMIASIQREVQKRTERQVPIILTSSETKRGGARMLSNMLDAVAPEPEPEPEGTRE